MDIEVREDKAIITGYVNATERLSKPLLVKNKRVREKMKSGVFTRALEKADNVQVLVNHDKNKVVANTNDNTAILKEDNIGLRAEVTVTDKETVEKAKNGKLVGWSFGFYCNAEEVGEENGQETRTVTDMDLVEVSILDDTKSPAYTGTLIETREDKQLEIRLSTIEEIDKMAREKHDAIYEASDKLHQKVNEETEKAKMEILADIIVNKLMEKLKLSEPIIETKSLDDYETRLKKLERGN